jgi:hypothetical protein
MMQMLAAGGMTQLTDFERKPDVDNPRGYCEWEPAKKLPKQPELIAEAEGKVVKVISQLLLAIPEGHEYKVIFMERPLPEVLASQDEMLRRRGTTDSVPQEAMANAFREHFRSVNAWFKKRTDVAKLPVAYNRVLEKPLDVSEVIKEFLGLDLNIEAMAAQVDPALYRNRKS